MRSAEIDDWLAQTGWANWARDPMTGDASARRYTRLIGPDNATVILMDAPPETCASQSGFVQIATHLRNLELAAPKIHNWDEALGLMVLEDLGQQDFAKHIARHPKDEAILYTAAIETLSILQSAEPPAGLARMTPDVGANMIDIAFEWASRDQSADLASEIKLLLRAKLQEVSPDPATLSLRDFHAENLIWRPGAQRNKRVGLLDFQDAFVTHPAYDLASLLRDARRDVDPALLDPLVRKLAPGAYPETKTAFHILAVQRNLRILGIFERLAQHDNKTGYRILIPRVWAHLKTDLATPEMAEIAPLIFRAFDPERTQQ